MDSLLSVSNLCKNFGPLPVIRNVNFEVKPGEVVGLTGNIGSGKSVLMMLLAGLYEPNEGDIVFNNKRLTWPFSAQTYGIGVIHQRPTLDDLLDVVSNIFLGNEIGWPGFLGEFRILNRIQMDQAAISIIDQLGLQVNSIHEKVSNLTGEQRQLIAIARVFTYNVRLIIIDEPTILLSYPYQQRLLRLIQKWQAQGISVLFSSNNLDHLFAVTDRIIILYQGKKVADVNTDETSRDEVVSYLLGAGSSQKSISTLWDYDSHEQIREYTEKLSYHQMLLGKDLAAETTLNRQLTDQLTEQIRALDQTNLALREAQKRLLTEREDERKYLARELHDQVIQDLLSINYELEEIETENNIPHDIAGNLQDIRNAIRELVESLRRICGNLRPLTIDSLGLGAALQSYTRDWTARTGIKVITSIDSSLGRLPEAIELSIFRIVQEGLSNVWRHAQATSVHLNLEHTSPRMLLVSLQDDGKGFSEDLDVDILAEKGHFGLMGISERVALLGGRFRIQRPPDGGLLLMVEIPHPRVEIKPERSF